MFLIRYESEHYFILIAIVALKWKSKAQNLHYILSLKVIFVPHGYDKESTIFAHIVTESGNSVKMTLNHILPAGTCGSSLPLTYASTITIGQCIQTIAGHEKVSKVGIIRGEGVYTIITNEEYVIVNGIIASSFGGNHIMANLYYNLHRFIHTHIPALLTIPLLHSFNEVRELIDIRIFTNKKMYYNKILWKILEIHIHVPTHIPHQ